MKRKKRLSAALQDYLEAILELDREKGAARVRDIAAALSVHKSTVTAALKSLSERGLVNYVPYELVSLTAEGRQIAEEVTAHHGMIRRFLEDILLVDENVSEKNACRMEHVMDDEVVSRLGHLVRFARERTRRQRSWGARFGEYLRARGEQT